MNRITRVEETTVQPSSIASELEEDSATVLLPVVGDLVVAPWLKELLDRGLRAVLLGETREEYVARAMTASRIDTETGEEIQSWIAEASGLASGPLLTAVDQEPWGIRRLHGLVPEYVDPSITTTDEFHRSAQAVAESAKALGVSLFLAPVLDILSGPNPWLEGRTLPASTTPEAAGELGAAFIRGTQAGGVASVAKHFPGFPAVAVDPALDPAAVVPAGAWEPAHLRPFSDAVAAASAGVMLGPVIVEDIDNSQPASTSGPTVSLLRDSLGFNGMILSDDLDAPATLVGRDLVETIVASLRAGADLVLINGGEHVPGIADHLRDLAVADPFFAVRLRSAADRVRAVADRYGTRGTPVAEPRNAAVE